ncbi:hypothetical protein EVAR_85481_1 [Eumeta japonica]|uniref:Uncharacterized protein n=1 Tax=Eumeta variegata TaxID=151549 RepID=A0A4C1VE47_EUMVA|nr:hypothetical protein EVAR_85481_1 [Eumeta japonica]
MFSHKCGKLSTARDSDVERTGGTSAPSTACCVYFFLLRCGDSTKFGSRDEAPMGALQKENTRATSIFVCDKLYLSHANERKTHVAKLYSERLALRPL